jgi:hypothetical protein
MLRRDFLYGLGGTLGTVAFNSMMAAESPLAPKGGHHPARAKNCIFIFMEGGPSHLDTFDPKPALNDLHMKEFQRKSKFASAMSSGKRYYVASPYKFRRAGKSGISICENYQHLATVADELCIYRGCQGESVNHPTACYHMNTGNRFGGEPAVGSWVSYGLGTANQNLPSFVVLPEVNYPQGGSANWANGYLPAHYQGTALRAQGTPILDLLPPKGVTRDIQGRNLEMLAAVNKKHAQLHPSHEALPARMSSYELAFRMQAIVPNLIDLSKESAKTKEAYGLGQDHTDDFGRRCLLARRMVENGVRFVQLYAGGWDSHDYLERAHSARIRSVDKPIAALIKDLKQRGMLEDTLVFCCGEFGRSPDNGIRGGGARAGRDHNAKAMTVWFAGGGTKAGHVIGATDEIGDKAVDVVHPIRDLHVTLLHLLGLNDNKLTFFDQGRYKQLSQIGGQLIPEILA